jgi:hypothetical protein
MHRTCRVRYLGLSSRGDGGRVVVLDGARVATAGLDGLDDALRLDIVIGDLAEDDVLAVQPRGHDSGDEELRAVAVRLLAKFLPLCAAYLRVGACVGHGQKEGLVVLQLEVLVAEFLAVNGLATGALPRVS